MYVCACEGMKKKRGKSRRVGVGNEIQNDLISHKTLVMYGSLWPTFI